MPEDEDTGYRQGAQLHESREASVSQSEHEATTVTSNCSLCTYTKTYDKYLHDIVYT